MRRKVGDGLSYQAAVRWVIRAVFATMGSQGGPGKETHQAWEWYGRWPGRLGFHAQVGPDLAERCTSNWGQRRTNHWQDLGRVRPPGRCRAEPVGRRRPGGPRGSAPSEVMTGGLPPSGTRPPSGREFHDAGGAEYQSTSACPKLRRPGAFSAWPHAFQRLARFVHLTRRRQRIPRAASRRNLAIRVTGSRRGMAASGAGRGRRSCCRPPGTSGRFASGAAALPDRAQSVTFCAGAPGLAGSAETRAPAR